MKITNLFHRDDTAKIVRLVERFLDGDTSPAEEQVIYNYYSTRQHVAPELEQYRPMFGWYASVSRRRVSHRRRYIAIAASLAVLIGVGIGIALNQITAEDPLYASYQGSYIIRDGQRIDDIRLIYANLTGAEQMADSLIALADREARHIEQSPDEIILRRALAGIDDPALAEEIKKAITE